MINIVDFRSPTRAARQQIYAVALCRVSTEDQFQRGLSIPEQRSRIEKWAEANGVQILKWEEIHHSAYRGLDEDTRVTDLLKYAAEDPRVTLFLVDEKSRFARRKFLRVTWQEELRRAGVRVVGVSEPDYDRNSIHGIWLEGISETKDEARSIETAYHTTKGMARNAATRDPETGFCYKNGGIAPLGYNNERVVRGKDPRGKDIVKLLWAVNEREAALVRYIVLTLWVDKRMSYAGIRNHLNSVGPKYSGIIDPIKSPKGAPWAKTSIREICMRGLEGAYTGYYYWNRTGRTLRGTGVKWKEKDDWVVIPDAHPAIISKEEWQRVKKIMEPIVKRNKRVVNTSGRTDSSPYLLSGENAIGEPLFICAACGGRIRGNQVSKRKYYLCSSYHNQGVAGCSKGRYIAKENIETKVIAAIVESFTKAKIKNLIREFNAGLEESQRDLTLAEDYIQKSLDTLDNSTANIMQAIEQGSSSIPILTARLEQLQEEKKDLGAELVQIKKDRPRIPRLHEDMIAGKVKLIENLFANPDLTNKDRKMIVRYFIRQLVFLPDSDEVSIYFWPNPAELEVLTLRGSAQKVIKSSGAEDRNRTGTGFGPEGF